MVSATFLTNILLATAALAAPSLEASLGSRANAIFNVGNWGGAVYSDPAHPFRLVTAEFTLPSISQVKSSLSVWIALDGVTCRNSSFRTGIRITTDSTGVASYNAWGQWTPGPRVNIPKMLINATQHIVLTINTSSNTTGSATIENTSTGQLISTPWVSDTPLCLNDAVWAVSSDGQLPNFGSVTFGAAIASMAIDNVGPADSTRLLIAQNNTILTTTSVSLTDVTVTYKG